MFEIQHWCTSSIRFSPPTLNDISIVDGLSRYHKFLVKDGRVFYRSRDGAEDVEEAIRKSGRYPGISFAQRGDPCERSASSSSLSVIRRRC